jgi:hypothetical protein
MAVQRQSAALRTLDTARTAAITQLRQRLPAALDFPARAATPVFPVRAAAPALPEARESAAAQASARVAMAIRDIQAAVKAAQQAEAALDSAPTDPEARQEAAPPATLQHRITRQAQTKLHKSAQS